MTSRPSRPFPAMLLRLMCCAAVMALTACASGQGVAPSSAGLSVSRPRPAGGSAAQLAALRDDRPQRRTLFEAQERAISVCMARRGLLYSPAAWQTPQDEITAADQVTAGDDVAAARTVGYGITAVPRQQPYDRNGAYVASLPTAQQAAYSEALDGTAQHRLDAALPNGEVTFVYTDGCIAQAEARIYGDLKGWLVADTTVINLGTDLDNLVRGDSALARTEQPWSACMAKEGYHFSTPNEARNTIAHAADKATQPSWKQLGGQEINQAVADATCDRAVGRARLARTLADTYANRLLHDRAPQITSYLTLRDRALANLTPTSRRAHG
ncbi:hypothetical protein ACIQ9Q_41905 [Streptomyces sp. NPDC094438]|uniref:hypothetical protein n=1 Tax=Streptomyces sp. NPDC094438 TaxID=3366061 RepID=UPI0037FBD277